MERKSLIKINDLENNADYIDIIGKKAAGLLPVKEILNNISQTHGLDLEIPQSYVLTTETYSEVNFENGKAIVPETIVNYAMQALAACGGNVAVRSNADIEDQAGNSYSGAFATVLNVTNRKQMRAALEEVYASSKLVDGAKMAVLIQPMIKPIRAGVAYSEEFNGVPNIVINYVHNKTADKLVVGEDKGLIRKHPKFIGQGDHFRRLTPENVNELPDYNVYLSLREELGENIDNLFGMYSKCLLASVVSQMEESLGHPIDVEFAISRRPDGLAKIHILQQRPYVANANLQVNYTDNNRLCGYFKDKPAIIEGEVVIPEGREVFDAAWDGQYHYGDYSGKIVLGKISLKQADVEEKYSPEIYQDYQEATINKVSQLFSRKENPACKDSLALIDTLDTIRTALYDHAGNVLRERGVPFIITPNKEDFSEVKNGDYMRINLQTGEYKVYPRHKLIEKGIDKKADMSRIDWKEAKRRR